MDALDHGVVDLVVGQVTPPGQHVRLGEDRVGQAVLRFVERRRANVEARGAQAVGDDVVDAIGIDRPDRLVGALVAVFVPDRDPRGHAAIPGRTTEPPRADDSRIASHSRAMRRPTSGGLGLGSRPPRTAMNCSHTFRDATDRTGDRRLEP